MQDNCAGDLVAPLCYVTALIATIRRIIGFAEQFQHVWPASALADHGHPCDHRNAGTSYGPEHPLRAIGLDTDDLTGCSRHVGNDIQAGVRLTLIGVG